MIRSHGWRTLALAELLVTQPNKKLIQQGWSPQCLASPAGPDRWGVLKTTAIQPGWFDDTKNKELPGTLTPRTEIEVHPGDLLITCAGPRARCGIPALVRSTRPKLLMSGKMYRFRPKPNVDSTYLELYLLSAEAQRRIDGMKTGISDSGLNLTHSRFLELSVPIPDLAEQRRIVAILEEHLSDLDDGARSVEAGQLRCTALFASFVASEMAGVEDHEVSLGDLSSSVKNGIFVSRAQAEPDGVAILRIGAVRPMRLDLSDLRYSSRPRDELAAVDALLRPADLLFTRYNGNPRFVGACALVPEGVAPLTWPDKLIRVRLRDEVADPTYVGYACSFGRGRRAIEEKLKTSAGQVGISGRELRSVRIPVPEIATQREIGQRLRARSLEVDRAKDALATVSRRSDSLRRGLLAAAFSGRLSGHGSDTDVIEELAEVESA